MARINSPTVACRSDALSYFNRPGPACSQVLYHTKCLLSIWASAGIGNPYKCEIGLEPPKQSLRVGMLHSLESMECWQRRNGGGGGNRTRVRKRFHINIYVRSPSFVIRRPGPRRARCPGSLGEDRTRIGRLRRPPGQGPLSSPQPPSRRSAVGRVAQLIKRRVPFRCWHLSFFPVFYEATGVLGTQSTLLHSRRNLVAPSFGRSLHYFRFMVTIGYMQLCQIARGIARLGQGRGSFSSSSRSSTEAKS